MSEIMINIYTFPAVTTIIFSVTGIFCHHKIIVYEDRKLHKDQFKLFFEALLMLPYGITLSSATQQLMVPIQTDEGLAEGLAIATISFYVFFRSLKHFLKLRK